MLLQSLYYFLPDSVDGTADLTQRKPQRVYVDSSWDKYPAFSPTSLVSNVTYQPRGEFVYFVGGEEG